MKYSLYLVIFLAFFSACSGYHFKQNKNPLAAYEIHSVAVPMFLNRSAIATANAILHKEITLLLSSYSGLKIYEGENPDADAVLVGIVEAKQHLDQIYRSDSLFTDGDLKKSIGQRNSFYVPSSTAYDLRINFYLIKRPTEEDLKLIESPLIPYVKNHPRIVLNEAFDLSGSFSREVAAATNPDSAGTVNYTKNRALLQKSLQTIAKDAAIRFEQEILNAF